MRDRVSPYLSLYKRATTLTAPHECMYVYYITNLMHLLFEKYICMYVPKCIDKKCALANSFACMLNVSHIYYVINISYLFSMRYSRKGRHGCKFCINLFFIALQAEQVWWQ